MGSMTRTIRFDDRIFEGVNEYIRISKAISGGLPMASINSMLEHCMIEGLGVITRDLQNLFPFAPKDASGQELEIYQRYNALRDDIQELEHLYLGLHFASEKDELPSDKEGSDNG